MPAGEKPVSQGQGVRLVLGTPDATNATEREVEDTWEMRGPESFRERSKAGIRGVGPRLFKSKLDER